MAEDFQQALVSAYQHNPRLMAERARVREIDENYVQAQAAGRFIINTDLSVGETRTETPSSFFGGGVFKGTPHSAQLSIVQPLYQGGRIKGLKAQAKAGILSARQGLRKRRAKPAFISCHSLFGRVTRRRSRRHPPQ